MLFSAAAFLFGFLPLVLLLYYLAPRAAKNHVLLIASLVFYLYGEAIYTFWLILSALFNWGMGLALERWKNRPRLARGVLVFTLIANLSLLFYYKYAAFFADMLTPLLGLSLSFSAPSLPVGISFYTFQAMSYTVDVYRGEAKASRDVLSFATYLCLFPQLIAGPIVRYTDVCEALDKRTHSLVSLADGVYLFVIGLAKKVIVADTLAKLVVLYRANTPSVLFAWLYAVAFTLEIYFDFSGYSDMAVGLGKLFGFSFPQNFRYPYIASSITDFWRRWHITLSSWFKSYVYIPLGGNRRGKWRLARNLLIVWLLTGLWHGSAWNFVLWGALYGLLLLFEKFGGLSLLQKLPRFFGHLYTLFFVTLGFVLFNASTLAEASGDLACLFGIGSVALFDARALYYAKSFLPFLLLSAFLATPLPKKIFSSLVRKKEAPTLAVKGLLSVSLLLLSVAFIVGESFRPFLYFRF